MKKTMYRVGDRVLFATADVCYHINRMFGTVDSMNLSDWPESLYIGKIEDIIAFDSSCLYTISDEGTGILCLATSESQIVGRVEDLDMSKYKLENGVYVYANTEYHLLDPDELREFLWLKPQRTNLPVDIFVDDGRSYLRHEHPLLLFARNGYTTDCVEFIPISVSEIPATLDPSLQIILSDTELAEIMRFTKLLCAMLTKLARQHITQKTFLNEVHLWKTYQN